MIFFMSSNLIWFINSSWNRHPCRLRFSRQNGRGSFSPELIIVWKRKTPLKNTAMIRCWHPLRSGKSEGSLSLRASLSWMMNLTIWGRISSNFIPWKMCPNLRHERVIFFNDIQGDGRTILEFGPICNTVINTRKFEAFSKIMTISSIVIPRWPKLWREVVMLLRQSNIKFQSSFVQSLLTATFPFQSVLSAASIWNLSKIMNFEKHVKVNMWKKWNTTSLISSWLSPQGF